MMKHLGWVLSCNSSTLLQSCVLMRSLGEAMEALDRANHWCDGTHQLIRVDVHEEGEED